jgi:hypothetical protein
VDEIEDRVRDQWKIGIGQFWAMKLSTAAANRPHRLHSVFIGQEKQKSAGALRHKRQEESVGMALPRRGGKSMMN